MILSLVSKKKVEDYLAALESGPACGEGFRSAWTAILIITDIESEDPLASEETASPKSGSQ